MVLVKEEGDNPWMVDQLEEFLYFCCPKCDQKCQMRDDFLKHAMDEHSEVRYTDSQKHESTLLHMYVMNKFLTVGLHVQQNVFEKNSYRSW